ncbi:hypothetical protein BaRGS_00016233, partial [Batillaria attramentaria]
STSVAADTYTDSGAAPRTIGNPGSLALMAVYVAGTWINPVNCFLCAKEVTCSTGVSCARKVIQS